MTAFALVAAFLPLKPAFATDEFVLNASQIEWIGDSISASGNVSMSAGGGRATAEGAVYNWRTGEARLTRSSFTTCACEKPDYRIEADYLALLPPNLVRARGVSVFLGRTRILRLPSLKTRVGERSGAFNIFPRISFDSESGFGLAYKFTLLDTDRLFATSDVRATTKDGIQADFYGIKGLDGVLSPISYDALTYPTFRDNALEMPAAPGTLSGGGSASVTNPARLRLSARFSSNLRTYNLYDKDLLVDRKPEVGVFYSAPEINVGDLRLDRRLRTNPEITASWGRFSEVDRTQSTDRFNWGIAVPVDLVTIGERTVVQPAVEYNRSRYGSDLSYTRRSYSLGISHMKKDGCLMSLRYTARDDDGTSPFEFDRVQVFHELLGAVQFQKHRWLAGFAAGYDTGTHSVYDWSAMIGHRTDCLGAALTWSQLERRLEIDLKLISR